MKKVWLIGKNMILLILGLTIISGVANSFLSGEIFTFILACFLSFICFYFSRSLFGNIKIKIVAYSIILIIYTPYVFYSVNQGIIANIKYDALQFIEMAEEQHNSDYINNEYIYCYTINGMNPEQYKYANAGNYIGSVSIDDNLNGTIQMSDGKYMVKGTSENIEIFKSKLTASNNCGK